MTIFQIKCFLEVGKYLNFTKAAESLYTSQPSITKHVLSLENELNLQLFIRTKHYVQFIPAGKMLFKEFQDILNKVLLNDPAVSRRILKIRTALSVSNIPSVYLVFVYSFPLLTSFFSRQELQHNIHLTKYLRIYPVAYHRVDSKVKNNNLLYKYQYFYNFFSFILKTIKTS